MNWCNFCRTMHPGGDRKPGCPNPDNPSGRLDTMPFPVGAESRERAMSEIARDENGRKLCTPARPWTEADGFPVVHQGAHEVGAQEPGWPGGDIVRMECSDCGARWRAELPQ